MPQTKPLTAADLRTRLQAGLPDMAKGTRRLADFVLGNPGAVALLSATEVAKRCDIHASSLVRLAQSFGLSGFRELQALLQDDVAASMEARVEARPARRETLRLRLLAESGRSFNQAAAEAADRHWSQNPEVEFHAETHIPHAMAPEDIAARIRQVAEGADGLLLVAREHPAINRAVAEVVAGGVPVVCLTSDLPASGRTAFVGSDQFASGSTAGWLCGRLLPRQQVGRVLFVCSVPFRCQLDREQGFRQVLRSDFPMLAIEEKVSSDESVEVVYDAIRRHIAAHGAPSAIYNVSGANLGIGRALEDEGLAGRVVFVGHELTANVRTMLEKGVMDATIGHDFDAEIAAAVDCITQAREGEQVASRIMPSLLHTRYNSR